MRRGHSEPASRGQQVVDVGSDLRWIRIPFALPVAVYLPIWTRKLSIVGSTPLANCIVRGAQAAIRPEMRCPGYGASGRCGSDDLPLLGKRSIKLHPDFQANAAVPIDGDVATGARLLRTHCIPDQPTTRESSDALAWRRITARGTLSSWSNWTAGDVNGLFLIISDQEMPDRLYEIKLATAFVMVTLCLFQPPRST
jgi:hypothetical protein